MEMASPPLAGTAEQGAGDPLAAWLQDGAGPIPVDTLLAYMPSDAVDAERYCLALYHQIDGVQPRPPDAFDALWARSAQLDPERRLLKAVYDLTLLDVCYEMLRHANLFGRWVRPRPKLAALMASSPCLRALYGESARRARATVFTPPNQYVKDLIRNLLLMLFLIVTIGAPSGLRPSLTAAPRSGRPLVQAAAVAMALSFTVWILKTVLLLPRAPKLLVADDYSAAVLRSEPWTFLWKSAIYDLLDEVIRRWMGLFALAFVLSLLDIALNHYVGSFVLIAATAAVISERCSPVAIAVVCSLAAVALVAQLSNLSLLWRFSQLLSSASGWVLAPFGMRPLHTFLADRPDFLAAVVLSQIHLPTALTLKPWRFADLFSEPCQMFLSAFFWSIVFSDGLATALTARLVFSLVSVSVLHVLQGPVSVEFAEKVHCE